MANSKLSNFFDFFDNQKVFGNLEVVKVYALAQELQKPESTILELLRPQLANRRMLDIGVGAGRTTSHFAPLVFSYLGIDYAPAMIDQCKKSLSGIAGQPKFRCHDARQLGNLGEGRFDLVLFSYNGLDFVGHADRLKILHSLRFLLNPGGFLVFSTHNLYTLTRHWSLRDCLKSSQPSRALATRAVFFALNGPAKKLEEKEYAIVRDGAKAFRIQNYCIKPEAQLKQLSDAGFRNTKVFSLNSGENISHFAPWTQCTDSWLYFLAET